MKATDKFEELVELWHFGDDPETLYVEVWDYLGISRAQWDHYIITKEIPDDWRAPND